MSIVAGRENNPEPIYGRKSVNGFAPNEATLGVIQAVL
jgi:hypothetical protein